MLLDVSRTRISLAAAFDQLYSQPRLVWLEHLVVKISTAGFLVHLALVLLANVLPNPPALIAAIGRNYLSAIYTPFSFILFYEVLMLILALPRSTTQSIAKQYEIVSLIFIRRFFKDIAELHDVGRFMKLSPEAFPVFLDVGAGLLMFLLVTLFLYAAAKRPPSSRRHAVSVQLENFIARKKAIALLLTVFLIALAVYSLGIFGQDIYRVVYQGAAAQFDPNTFFYADVFTLMIFTDVLILILSLAVSDSYELVFRNAAFVIATILMRFALTAGRPYGAALALSGMAFGILTLLVYNFHVKIRRAEAASS